MIGTIPNIFRRIEFRGIRRKTLHANPRMPRQKFLHFFAPMDGGPIPQKDQRPPKMFQQIFQKSSHIQPIQIPLPELDKKSQPSPFRRHDQRTDRRNLVLPVTMIQPGRLSPGSPRACDRRNEQKAALIEKKQVGAKFFRVFLYAENGIASNGRSLLPFSPKPGVRVSGNSTPSLRAIARHDWGGIGPQSSSELFALPAAGSTGRSDIRKLMDRPARAGLVSLFARVAASADAREPSWTSAPWTLSPDRPETTGRRSFWMPRATGRWPIGLFCPFSIIEWRVGAAFPARFGCHGVSCSSL
jgi:hypothetical protein